MCTFGVMRGLAASPLLGLALPLRLAIHFATEVNDAERNKANARAKSTCIVWPRGRNESRILIVTPGYDRDRV